MNQDSSTLATLFDWIQQETGLYITQVNKHPVQLALKVLSSESRISESSYIEKLILRRINPQPFIDEITTHESFFLRHQKGMKAAIQHIITPLLNKGIRPRILSAPCAQGEEPYSLAMLLQDQGINPSEVEITGIDIAARSIQQARNGAFRKYALRQVPNHFIRQHFIQHKETYNIYPQIRNSVKFTRLNLLTQAASQLVSGYHLIFSHNMLIYFDQQTCQQMIRIFQRLLHEDGHLMVDSVETSLLNSVMHPVTIGNARSFQKMSKKRTEIAAASSHQPTPRKRSTTKHSNKTEKPPTATPSQISDKRHSATQAYEEKNFDEARKLFDQLIENHPLWESWARVGKARILMDSGEEMEALEEAEKALNGKQSSNSIHLDKTDMADAHAIIAMVLNHRGFETAKLDHLQQVRKLNPNHAILKLTR